MYPIVDPIFSPRFLTPALFFDNYCQHLLRFDRHHGHNSVQFFLPAPGDPPLIGPTERSSWNVSALSASTRAREAKLALSQAAYVHLAAFIPNMTLAIDTEQTCLASDIAPNGPRLKNGSFEVPMGPGLGIDPDIDALERYRVDSKSGAYLDLERPGWFPVKPAY